jgi:acetylglutamate kinase
MSTKGETVDLGRVGEPVGREKPALLVDLCRKGYLPVVASIGASREGLLFNVNADTLAAHLAGRLKSPRLVIAGATAGVLDSAGATIREMTFRDMEVFVGNGGATAGMVAKLAACRSAIENGAREIFIADGKDLTGLAVLVRNGRAAGAAKSTKVGNARSASSRQINKRAS